MSKLKDLTRMVCVKCGHTWVPRVKYPTECPACKSRQWDKK